MPAGSGIGYIVLGVVIGIVLGWLLNDVALWLGKRSQASQLKEKEADIEDLEEELDHKREELRSYRRERIAGRSKRKKDTP